MMLAAALRLYQLGAEGLWFDEANTAVLATLPISELIERISVDNQAPLYFLLVKAATALLGHAEWAVRSVSAAAGVALVWLAHDVGRRLLSRNAARWAAGIWDSEFPWQIPRTWAALTHGSLAPIRNRVPDIVSPAWIALGCRRSCGSRVGCGARPLPIGVHPSCCRSSR